MVNLLLIVAMFLPQEAPAPQGDHSELRKHLDEVSRQLDEAIEAKDRAKAEKLLAELKETYQKLVKQVTSDQQMQLDKLAEKIRELSTKHDAAAEALKGNDQEAYGNRIAELYKTLQETEEILHPQDEAKEPTFRENRTSLEFEFLATHWDNDLELRDGAGWGAGFQFDNALQLGYRRWEVRDERHAADATVQTYTIHIPFEPSGNAGKDISRMTLSAASILGLAKFDSDASGVESDLGPLLSIDLRLGIPMSPNAKIDAGLIIDLLRTDFNQTHTHTNHNFTAGIGITFGF